MSRDLTTMPLSENLALLNKFLIEQRGEDINGLVLAVRDLENYRVVLERLGCTFRKDGTVLTSEYRDQAREEENERLRQWCDEYIELRGMQALDGTTDIEEGMAHALKSR